MILVFSGCDGTGKSSLARDVAAISEKAFGFKLALFNTDVLHPDTNAGNWSDVVNGINVALCQTFASLDNFVKDRYSLDEFAYQQYYNRKGLDQHTMECCGIEKQVLVFVDCGYERYLENVKNRNEKLFTREQFEKQRNLFIAAFDRSIVPVKKRFQNDGTYTELLTRITHWIISVHNSAFHILNKHIMNCSACSLRLQCGGCNPEYNRPILAKCKDPTKVQYLFVGYAPGRAVNKPMSIECFSHSSGGYLHKVLTELNIIDRCAFTNVCKCNTPKDRKITQEEAAVCIEQFLSKEVGDWIYPEVKKIFVLGADTYDLFDELVDTNIPYVRVNHPSALNYGYTEEKYNLWKNSIYTAL